MWNYPSSFGEFSNRLTSITSFFYMSSIFIFYLFHRKTGWANQPAPGVDAVTSDEFPDDSADKIQKAHVVLTQLTGSGLMAMASLGLATGVNIQATDTIASSAEAAVNAALGVANENPMVTSPTSASPALEQTPTCTILVHNMFDKDEETEEGWHNDIKEEFEEEASSYGTLAKNQIGEPCVKVMFDKPGGMVYAKFETADMAKLCADALGGRWFDKRQLCVEYVEEYPE